MQRVPGRREEGFIGRLLLEENLGTHILAGYLRADGLEVRTFAELNMAANKIRGPSTIVERIATASLQAIRNS